MKTQTIINADCIEEMQKLEAESIDILFTDPPYKYLKNQKLEIDFDEEKFFNESFRVVKKGGFVVIFGRGTSFYRWNTMLADRGFEFKEEIVWDKGYCSSPLLAISRVHETVAIYTKGKNKINRCKVPYVKMREHDLDRVIQDVNRLKSTFKNTKSLNAVLNYLETNNQFCDGTIKTSTTISSEISKSNRCAAAMKTIKEGMNEKSIIREDFEYTETSTNYKITKNKGTKTGNRCVNVLNSICIGMNEKSIIKQGRDHYNTIHPTQKPVALLKRILNLVIKSENDLVLDPFAGSCSTGVACKDLYLPFIGYEIDKEFFEAGKKRLEEYEVAEIKKSA